MRIVFMGTPAFSLPALDRLAERHEIVAAYCQPPRPGGRGQRDRPSPVQARAEALGIPVRHPARLRGAEEQAAFAALGADVAVVVAYGLILPKPVLEAPRFGCLNLHASLLPRWRGAAPIHRAVLAGDPRTGVCLMRMEEGLDTGPVLARAAVTIGAEETTGDLHNRLAALGARLIGAALEGRPENGPPGEGPPEDGPEAEPGAGAGSAGPGTRVDSAGADGAGADSARIGSAGARTRVDNAEPDSAEADSAEAGGWLGRWRGVPQPEAGVTYAAKIGKGEARIDWTRPAAEVDRLIRGLSPVPGAWCEAGGERLKLLRSRVVPGQGAPGEVLEGLRIACGAGAVEVSLAQREGRRPMAPEELLRGFVPPRRLG